MYTDKSIIKIIVIVNAAFYEVDDVFACASILAADGHTSPWSINTELYVGMYTGVATCHNPGRTYMLICDYF